jgi:hypothetical protein
MEIPLVGKPAAVAAAVKGNDEQRIPSRATYVPTPPRLDLEG